MRQLGLALGSACILVALSGCGGSGGGSDGVPDVPPDEPQVHAGEVTIGPFVIHPAAATNMQLESLPNDYGSAFAVFSGVTIDYVAVRELMDRVVFVSYRTGDAQLFTCDFFGDNAQQITFNSSTDKEPRWSPDGTQLAWAYFTNSHSDEILVRPATGGAATQLTLHAAIDRSPTWSPDGRWIAFQTNRSTDWDIFKMLVDGSNQVDLINDGVLGPSDMGPAWAPGAPEILFASDRTGKEQIFLMNADGTNQHQVVTSTSQDFSPAWHPDGKHFACCTVLSGVTVGYDIYTGDTTSGAVQMFEAGPLKDDDPCYSTDAKYIFFSADRTGDEEIWAKQIAFPHRLHRITTSSTTDWMPHLGSPTVQISRVLIGPNGSDHGYNPVHNAAVAGVVAFNNTGYLNFIRLGVPSASGTSLTATPLEDTGITVVGVVLSAPDMYYLEEDAGLGLPPTIWDFSGLTSRSAALYMDAYTGKLVAVMDMGDSVHAASADNAADIIQRRSGAGLIVSGHFRRVYDGDGRLVGEGEGEISSVEIDAANRVVHAY